MAWGTQIWGTTQWGSADPGIGPYLVSEPLSPNGNFTAVPMIWVIGDDVGGGKASSIVLEGKTVVTNNVIQSGFTGTVVANAYNGYTISVVADEHYREWQPLYELDWAIDMVDDVFNTSSDSGSIIKYVSLPPPDELVEAVAAYLENFDFPYRYNWDGNLALTGDKQAIEHNMRNSVMICKKGIPLSTDLGSNFPMMPIDQIDDKTRELIINEIIEAVEIGEPRALLDATVRFVTQEGDTLSIAIPYLISMTENWESLYIPIDNIDKK